MFKKTRLALKRAQVARLKKATARWEANGWRVKRSLAMPGAMAVGAFALMAANRFMSALAREGMGESAGNAARIALDILPIVMVMWAALKFKRWGESPFEHQDREWHLQQEQEAARELEVLELDAVARPGAPSASKSRL